jgi:hypothetical protein
VRDAPDREALARTLFDVCPHPANAKAPKAFWLIVADAAIAALTGDSKS